jgi:hypothetical protein
MWREATKSCADHAEQIKKLYMRGFVDVYCHMWGAETSYGDITEPISELYLRGLGYADRHTRAWFFSYLP